MYRQSRIYFTHEQFTVLNKLVKKTRTYKLKSVPHQYILKRFRINDVNY